MTEIPKNHLAVLRLDGLLCGPDGTMSAANRAMLSLYCGRGGRYTVFSDWGADAVRHALAGLPQPAAPVILCGGAMLYDLAEGRTLARTPLDKADAGTILWLLERGFSGLGLAVQICGAPVQILRANSYTEEYLKAQGYGGILLQADDLPENDWLSAEFFAPAEILGEVESLIRQKGLSGEFRLSRRGPTRMELLPKAADSFRALEQAAGVCGLLPQSVWTIGSVAGDEEWMCGTAARWAAADAPAPVRLCAKETTLCTVAEGAAAEALYRILKHYE